MATLNEKELMNEIPTYDALVVRFSTKVTIDVLLAATNLKVIACAGSYFGNVDLCAAKNLGVAVINAPIGDNLSACEYTCCLTMALARNTMKAMDLSIARHWDPSLYVGTELKSRTIAIIGLSEIAKKFARCMSVFKPFIMCYDSRYSASYCKRYSAIKMELNQIWPVADYIIIFSTPFGSNQTYINEEILRACKRGVKIIIIGKSNVFDTIAMMDALNTGHVSGAGLDMYDEDLTLLKQPIFNHPSVIASMHLGVQTEEAVMRCGQEAAEQLINLCFPGTYYTSQSTVVKFQDELPHLVTSNTC
ncbi:D-3-phosphoglycerate dehydrogenase [Papilio xuthus]|uniref:D-3-phosphoglycerate dehydrogenase n=1 Tax=Papilio xuthus TaxID=66420 RepID=A0A194PEQ3_PAPXU|nr:D-3-phosphoglycerate dehydrogenase [Papilio xuthus]